MNILNILNGYRSYGAGAAIILSSVAFALGYIDQKQLIEIVTAGSGAAILFLRLSIAKLGQKK